MRLLYIADPLCSWCYGFGPELSKLLASHADTRLDLVMGGLRPFNREAMSDAFRTMLREHWHQVAKASGLAFSEAILAREAFIYDTEPACRAVVTARAMAPAMAYGYLKAVQVAFYRDAREVTRPEVLSDVAAESGYGRELFLERLQSDAMREETLKDFSTTQSLGISGFPTLAVEHGQQLYLATSGYVTAEVLEQRLEQIELRAAQPQ
jgi:putative protein-disulfide isomerase